MSTESKQPAQKKRKLETGASVPSSAPLRKLAILILKEPVYSESEARSFIVPCGDEAKYAAVLKRLRAWCEVDAPVAAATKQKVKQPYTEDEESKREGDFYEAVDELERYRLTSSHQFDTSREVVVRVDYV